MIPFNKPPFVGSEKQHILDVLGSGKNFWVMVFGHRCQDWFVETLGAAKPCLRLHVHMRLKWLLID